MPQQGGDRDQNKSPCRIPCGRGLGRFMHRCRHYGVYVTPEMGMTHGRPRSKSSETTTVAHIRNWPGIVSFVEIMKAEGGGLSSQSPSGENPSRLKWNSSQSTYFLRVYLCISDTLISRISEVPRPHIALKSRYFLKSVIINLLSSKTH